MGMRTRSEPTPSLLNRQRERAALDGLLGDLRSGRGRALVVRGEAGVGKSALLEYVIGAAPDLRVVRAAGVESEMELAFAGLHQLCAPLLDRLEGLPGPQRDALGVAFGLREGAAPDRFLVGLAVLTLLSEAAGDRALLELPRGLSPAQLAGGFGLTGARAVPARIEESFRNRLGALPADTRVLLLVAAAEPVGDAVLVRTAAERLGIAVSAAAAAAADG